MIAGTDKFNLNGRLAPKKSVPPRLPSEPQAWVSVTDQILDTPLKLLKCFVYQHIHIRPSVTEVRPQLTSTNIIGGRGQVVWRHSNNS